MINCLLAYPQSKTLEKYIESKLKSIDENIQKKQYDIALSKVNEIETYTSYLRDDKNRLSLQLKKAIIFYKSGNQQKAMDMLMKGYGEANVLDKKDIKILYAQYLGEVFDLAKNYSKSRHYYKISLDNFKSKSDTLGIITSYLSIGRGFYNEENNDSARLYFNKVITYPLNTITAKKISNAYNNLSAVTLREGNLILAEEYGNESLKIVEQQKDTIGIAMALVNLSNIQFSKGEYNKIKENYIKAFQTVKNLKTRQAISVKETVLFNLAYVSEGLKDYKSAYHYLDQATTLADSISKANISKNISEIEAKYNVAKEAQKTEEEKSKRLKAQVLFYGLAFAFLSFMVLGYIFYRNYRLKQQHKLEQIENEAQTKIINATIDAKEKERKSIAETLHDSVSALLSSANLHLQATKAQLKKDAPREISKAQTIVNEASVKIRDLSHELISSVLLKFGLAFAVHDMCQKYSNSEITLHSDDNGIKRYDQDFEIKIYNIIEELINNILKHSKASNATIMLAQRENNMLSIRISDDGIGFDIKTARKKDGLGLSHINARIKVMKGVFNVVSSKDNGASIFIFSTYKI